MIDLGISGFFSDIKNVFSRSNVLGIDIGTTSIKLVEVSKKGENMTLENYGILETQEYLKRGNAALQTSALKLSERDVLPVLKKIISETKPKTKIVAASIPIFNAFFVTIDMPELQPKEIAGAIKFQAKQYVPIPMDQVNLEWVRLDNFQNERGQIQQKYLLTVVPLATIESMRSIFKKAGLKLAALEVENKSIARSLTSSSNPITQIIDIGSESTSIFIVDGGVVKRVAQIDNGGASLTRSLARTLDISAFRSENLKRRKGLLGSGGEYEISRALIPFIDIILNECTRIRVEYENNTNKKVQDVLITGGGANLLGIEDYVKKVTGLQIKSGDALKLFEMDVNAEPMRKSLSRSLSVASGLALQFFV
ncbi:MAG: type IV pilus assembly protein PilM [Candidatus Jorgensenbacteria bacterium]|nr:type IV pilus assembly protein PilM [Candidatus Jorgensenbacteria bacterium]